MTSNQKFQEKNSFNISQGHRIKKKIWNQSQKIDLKKAYFFGRQNSGSWSQNKIFISLQNIGTQAFQPFHALHY